MSVARRRSPRDGERDATVVFNCSVQPDPMWAERFYNRFVPPATPGALGAIRVLVCAILLVSTLWEDLASTAALPIEMLFSTRHMGVMTWLTYPPAGEFVLPLLRNPAVLDLFEAGTALLLVLAMVGCWTRFTVPVAAVMYLVLGGILRQYSWFYHTGLVPLYVLFVLSFLPSGDGWSLDRLRRIARGEPVPDPHETRPQYGWGRYACWIAIAMPYVAAGMSKLRALGLNWIEATNFRTYLYGDSLNPMEFTFNGGLWLRHLPDLLVEALAAAGMFGELFFGLVLVSKLGRWCLPVMMGLMHVGILFLQNILFFDLILLQTVFYNWTPLVQSVGCRARTAGGAIELCYDGSSSLWTRRARVVDALDLFGRIDFRTNNDSSAGPWRLVSRGGSLTGAESLSVLARVLPVAWVLLPVVRLRPLRSALWSLLCPNVDEQEEQEIAGDAGARFIQPSFDKSAVHRRYAAGAAAFFVLLLGCWAGEVEYYPLTAMRMYTTPRFEGEVRYRRVLAHFADGTHERAPIEQAIGAMRDGRYRLIANWALGNPRDDEKMKDLKRRIVTEFFDSCALRHNVHSTPERQIVAFEVQQWFWDFDEHPHDLDASRLIGRVRFPVGDADSAAVAEAGL